MTFWLVFAAYELVWLAAVAGAGHGLVWPGVGATVLFASWRLAASRRRAVELKLIGTALLLGAILEHLWVRLGLIRYGAAWPLPSAPAWLLALWAAFALTIVPLFGYLHTRPWLAAALGAVGGPLAYLGAARGWRALSMLPPQWHALLALSIGWAVAMPTLMGLARHWLQALPPGRAP